MTRSHIRVLATPGPSTQSLVSMLRAYLPANAIVLAPSSSDVFEHANDESSGRFLVLVAHPADTVATAIAAGQDGEQALSDWSAAARALLKQIQRQPSRCLIIDADEALASPQHLGDALGRWDETLRGFAPGKTEALSSDPLASLLGRIAAEDDVASRRLFAELQARSAMLAKPVATPVRDWRAAVRHRQRDIDHRVAEQAQWTSQLEAVRAQFKDQQEALARTQGDAGEWRRHAEESKKESSMLALQLEQAQEEQAHWTSQLEAVRAQFKDQQEALARTQGDAGEWRRHAEESKKESSMLALQLEQAQEELETLYQGHGRAQVRPESIRAGRLRFLDTSTAAPFRHLHIDLQQVQASDRRWDSLEVRLVEHHGRPGIAFFATGRAQEPLASWQASGREGIREFVLLVPGDSAGQGRLAALGTSDWHMVVGTVDLLVRELPGMGGDVATEWAFIARRLQADLQGIEPRLRYDACTMHEDGSPDGSYRIEFNEVTFGSQTLGRAELRWQPVTGELEWLAPDDGTPVPLAGWPPRDDRSRATSYRVLGSRNGSLAARKAEWLAQPARNRALLLAVLEALPEAANRRPQTARFAAAAGTLLDELRRWQRGRTWRSAVKSLLRRA